MNALRACLALLISVVPAVARVAQPPELPIETIFKKANITGLSFSPDGRRIACLVPYEHRMNVAVIDLEKKTKNLLSNFTDNDVSTVMWASDDRLIFIKDEDGQESPLVYAVNRDGTGRSLLAGATKVGTTQEVNNRFRGLLARLPKDPTNFLALGNLSGAQGPDVCSMNLQTGRLTLVTANPGYVRRWILDRERRVRLGVAQQGQTVTVLILNEAKGTWEPVQTGHADAPGWSPIAFDGDNRTLFVSSNVGRKTEAIYHYDTQARTLGEMVFGHDIYDAGNVLYDEARKKAVGISYQADRERFHWIDPEAEQLQRRFDASLPDTVNYPRHASSDGSRQLLFSTSDRDPGVYYLFDKSTKKLEELAVVKPGIDPEQMAPMKHLTFKARDGLTIHGYLTLPVGRDPQNLPLILHPHGGPFGIRDHWTFSPEIQFYANRGYAVLQVNYRGSGGYGDGFERAGWKKWGLEMQHDLSDAVKWAVDQGVADPQRVVIAGASYGGYATMAGLAFTPELYCAGINYVGVVDIDELIPRGDGASKERAHWYATRIADLGNAQDRQRLHDTSPVHFADRIRAPVLMAYGKNDPRVRINQGYDMEAALKKAGKTYEMIIEKDEGHGFRKEELSIAFFTKVDEFLKKYVHKANVRIGPTQVIEMPAKSRD